MPRSYALDNKFWLNSKYIKTEQNLKLAAKFLGPYWVLHPMSKQVYKIELPKNCKIQDVFYISLLE